MAHEMKQQTFFLRRDVSVALENYAQQNSLNVDHVVNESIRAYLSEHHKRDHLDIPTHLGPRIEKTAPHEAIKDQPPLYIWYNNKCDVIQKPRYVIGRSSEMSDLVIDFNGISRQHCAVLYEDGEYLIVDLKSTNGIEFQNDKILRRHINEGDSFFLCELKITFSFRQ